MNPILPDKLAGLSLPSLRDRYRRELFDEQLPFWDRYGIDHDRGGFLCALDYGGARVNHDKFVWFQGRGLWVYSFLYNYLDQNRSYLEVARKTKEFLFRHFPQPDGSWASVVTQEGDLVEPSADEYGQYFAIEGLQEYAHATGDEQAWEASLRLFKKLFQDLDDPQHYRETATGARLRPQGFWMINLHIARQMLERCSDPEVVEIADRSLDAVLKKHYNPEIGLNNEELRFDFSPLPGEENKCNLGHSVETLWMAMSEGLRRQDQALVELCIQRIYRHLDVGWDRIYGGLALWVNVDHGAYEWPVERVPGTDLEFHAVGEYNYTKALWALDEVLIATLMVLEQTGAHWAASYFERAQQVIDEKFSMKSKYGQPTYVLFADRKITPPPRSVRQDNYHRLRALMLNILTLDLILAAQPGLTPTQSQGAQVNRGPVG